MGSASWPRSGSLNGWQDFGHEDTAVTRNDRSLRFTLGKRSNADDRTAWEREIVHRNQVAYHEQKPVLG
jgi:hypothetical protein